MRLKSYPGSTLACSENGYLEKKVVDSDFKDLDSEILSLDI